MLLVLFHGGEAVDLMRGAKEGKLSIITEHGRPTILAIPFGERLLSFGGHRILASRLFAAETLPMAQATTIAGLPVELLLKAFGKTSVPAARYDPEQLAGETRYGTHIP